MGNICFRITGESPEDEQFRAYVKEEEDPQEQPRPDILDLDASKIEDFSDSDRSAKNLQPLLPSFSSQCHEIIDSQAIDAIQGYYGSMRKQTSIDPEMEYCRLVNVVWPEDIRPLLIKVLSAEKIDKLLCGFVMITFDIAKGRFVEILSTVAKVIKEPFQEHRAASSDLQTTIAHGRLKEKPDEFEGLSSVMQEQVMSHFRKEAEKVNLGEMADIQAVLQMLHEQMYINHKEKAHLASIPSLQSSFQQPLARIMWMMANAQHPRYQLERPHLMKPWSPTLRRVVNVTEDSDMETEGVVLYIKYYCKPVLYLDGQIVDKGLVKVGSW